MARVNPINADALQVAVPGTDTSVLNPEAIAAKINEMAEQINMLQENWELTRRAFDTAADNT